MICLLVAGMIAAAGTAFAATYNLRADRVSLTMPDGSVVPAWGFADDTAGPGTVTVPGPQLVVPGGDTALVINLQNNLPVPVSISIPGQPYPVGAAAVNKGGRVMSFTHQVDPNSSAIITFNNLRPGTFRYESGTHPAMDVPMGLYGALIVRPAAAGQAYATPVSAYDNEAVMVLSEVDPAFNRYVDANQTTVDPASKINYSISYAPRYFLINGKAYPQTEDIAAPRGQRTLLRIVNAGIRNTSVTLQGTALNVIAEDGNPLNYVRHEFSPSLTAGKSLDIITAPTGTGYRAFYDRRLGTSNAGVWPGGILTFIGDLQCSPVRGDVTGDGRITTADALTALRAFVDGNTGSVFPAADVSLDAASGLPCGDGNIGLDDVLLLLRKAVGIDGY